MKNKNSLYFCVADGAVFAHSTENAKSKFSRAKKKTTHCKETGIQNIK